MATIKAAKRVFIVGATRIDDPAPGQPLEATVRILSPQYPQFRWTELYEEDGKAVGDTIEYTLELPPLKVKG